MTTKIEPTFWAKIYLAGDVSVIKQECRKYCFEVGLCVTITPTNYIYTGGEESGVEIGLINYPRFPSTKDVLLSKAKELGERLMLACHQWSFLVMTPDETIFSTRREDG